MLIIGRSFIQDTFLQVTTCGWIMWLLQVGQLASGASLVTYDGSPLYPTAFTIPQIVSSVDSKVTAFGGSPRLLSEMQQACKRGGIKHLQDCLPMPQLRLATSTGSPLSPANVRFFYQGLANKYTQLMSISGGTDLAGCLVGSAVNVPVNGHLIGVKSLAMDIRIVDPVSGEDCEMSGTPGELVVARPFPTQPVREVCSNGNVAMHTAKLTSCLPCTHFQLYFWGDPKDKDKLHEKYMDSCVLESMTRALHRALRWLIEPPVCPAATIGASLMGLQRDSGHRATSFLGTPRRALSRFTDARTVC